MRLFHRTSAADVILLEGFRDATDSYMTDVELTGVWFSDRPLDPNDGAFGDIVLALDVPDGENIEDYEFIEERIEPGSWAFRTWLIPAQIANRFGPPSVFDEGDIDA